MLLASLKVLVDALAALQTVRDSTGFLAVPQGSPLEKAIDRTAHRFASSFPNLGTQLKEAIGSPDFRETLASFAARGTIDVRELVEQLTSLGLYLPTAQDVQAAQDALSYFVEAFNEEVLRNPATGLVVADARSASRAAALAENLAAVREMLDATAASTQRIEAVVHSNPGDELAVLREAASTVPLPAAIKMYELFEQRLRRTGGWTREVEAQVQLEVGAAAWRVRDMPTAARYFEQAYALDPRDFRIRLNSGLALAIHQRWDDALERIEAVIREVPDHARASIAKAQVLQMSARAEEALQVLRPVTVSPAAEADAYRLHIGAAVTEGLFDEAVDVAERGLRHRQDATSIAALAFAHAARADASFRAGRVNASVTMDLDQAIAAFQTAIETSRRNNEPRVLLESLVGLANALMQSGRAEDALTPAREARAIDSRDEHAALTLATLALATQHYEEAYSAAAPLAKSGNAAAQPVAFAAFGGLNPTATAERLESVAVSFGLTVETSPFPVFDLLVDAALRESTIGAEALAARWVGPPAQKLLIQARIAFKRSDRAAALDCLHEALAALRAAPDPITAFRVGELADEIDEHGVSASAFELVPVTEASPLFMIAAYVHALLNAEKSDGEPKILRLAAALTEAGVFSPPAVHAEATMLEHRGELERAAQLWSALAERDPKRSSTYQGALARCLYRLGRSQEAAAALARIADTASLGAPELFMVAEIHKRLGQYDFALTNAYAALQKQPDDPVVGFNYLVLFMGLPQGATASTHLDTVADGAIVTLEFARGERHAVGIGTQDLPFDASSYPSTSKEARLVLGRKTGDVVTWTTGPAGPVEGTIREISHPFLFAARALLATIQHRFPGKSPIASVEIGEHFAGPKRIMAEAAAEDERIVNVARELPVPFGLMAARLGRDLFRVWSSLEAIPFKVLVSTNTIQELAIESQALQTARGVVLDPLSLLDLKALGLFDRIAAFFPTVLVPQASIDVLRECRDSLVQDAARGELLTVGVEHGDLAPTVISKAQLEHAAQFLADVLSFCETRCVRVGRPRPFTSRENEFLKFVTEPFLVSMVVAGEQTAEGVRLLSNEVAVRALAREACGASSFSVLSLIQNELAQGSIQMNEYSDLMRFCLRRMRHVTLHSEYFTHLVVSSRPVPEYAQAVDALLHPDLPRDPALRVALTHVRQVAVSATVWESAAHYLQLLFLRIGKRHGRIALRAIRQALESPGLVVVPNVDRAVRLILVVEKIRADEDGLSL